MIIDYQKHSLTFHLTGQRIWDPNSLKVKRFHYFMHSNWKRPWTLLVVVFTQKKGRGMTQEQSSRASCSHPEELKWAASSERPFKVKVWRVAGCDRDSSSSSRMSIRALKQAYSLSPETNRSVWTPEASTGTAHCKQQQACFFFFSFFFRFVLFTGLNHHRRSSPPFLILCVLTWFGFSHFVVRCRLCSATKGEVSL